jgi:hypothetical protein
VTRLKNEERKNVTVVQEVRILGCGPSDAGSNLAGHPLSVLNDLPP